MAGARWLFTRSQLYETPSRKCGYEYDKELSYRQQAANYIQDMGQRLQVTQLCINTAIVYMHRFYMIHSFSKFHRNSIATACLFLAAKVEEQPRKLEHVIKVSHLCLHREAPPDPKSEAYLEQAQELVVNENILLQSLGFEISIDHPHTHVVKTCQLVRASKDLAQTSYFLATNSLHLTNMCLQYKPTVVACVCIHLACKWSNWELPVSSEGKEWFWYVDKEVTLQLLEELTQEFLTILDKCPSKLRRKIMNWKSGLRDEEAALMGGAKPKGKVDPNLIASTDTERKLEKTAAPGAMKNVPKDLSSYQINPSLSTMTKESASGYETKPGTSTDKPYSRSVPVDAKRIKQEVSITPEEYRQRREKERQAVHGGTSHRPDASSNKHSSSLGKSQSSSNAERERHFSDIVTAKDQRIQHSRPPEPNRDKRHDQHLMRQHGSGRHDVHGMRPDAHRQPSQQSSSAKRPSSASGQPGRMPAGGGANGGHAHGSSGASAQPPHQRALEFSVHNQQHFDKLKQQSREKMTGSSGLPARMSHSSSSGHKHGHSTSYHSSMHKSNHLKHASDPTTKTSSPQLQRKRPHSPSSLQSTSSHPSKIPRNDSSSSLPGLTLPPTNSSLMNKSIHEALTIDTEAAKSLSANGSSAGSPAIPVTPSKEHLNQVNFQLQQLIQLQANKLAAVQHYKQQPPSYPHMPIDQQPPLPPAPPPAGHPPLPPGYPPPPPGT